MMTSAICMPKESRVQNPLPQFCTSWKAVALVKIRPKTKAMMVRMTAMTHASGTQRVLQRVLADASF